MKRPTKLRNRPQFVMVKTTGLSSAGSLPRRLTRQSAFRPCALTASPTTWRRRDGSFGCGGAPFLDGGASAWRFSGPLLGAALDGFSQLLAGFNAVGFGFHLGLGPILAASFRPRRASSDTRRRSAWASSRSFLASASSLLICRPAVPASWQAWPHFEIDAERYEEDEGDGNPGCRIT